MTNSKRWFVIINPTSGNGSSKRKWPKIKAKLKIEGFDFDFKFTEYPNHSINLIQNAINQDFRLIICIGGDGTLHNIINGIQRQSNVKPYHIQVGIIPIGTGNDWIKTYKIPLDFNKAISIIKNDNLNQQDLGKIEFLNKNHEPIFFNNLAGIGFDGFVVSKVGKFKHLGSLAYLIGAVFGLFRFKNFPAIILLNNKEVKTTTLMVLVGLCKFSGGGMQLTKDPIPDDGLFDISIAKNLTKLDIITNLFNLFNGNIVNHSKVENHKTANIIIKINSDNAPFIQADGELIGTGAINLSIIPKAFSFYCK